MSIRASRCVPGEPPVLDTEKRPAPQCHLGRGPDGSSAAALERFIANRERAIATARSTAARSTADSPGRTGGERKARPASGRPRSAGGQAEATPARSRIRTSRVSSATAAAHKLSVGELSDEPRLLDSASGRARRSSELCRQRSVRGTLGGGPAPAEPQITDDDRAISGLPFVNVTTVGSMHRRCSPSSTSVVGR